MRNLKRALSLALAAAMLISLMVVGASAASYGDADSIDNTEAVDFLTAIGVVGGDQNGNYNPDATLTRAEFCVMIANALTGGTFDRTLFEGTNTPFTDVPGHWGQAYIAYCYSVGVIAGTSATTFGPDNTLTAAQASAILLSALGYNQNSEFAANGQFELNVTRWAQNAGLYDELSVSATAGITRDQTAKLIYNAMMIATPVVYSNLINAYSTEGYGSLSGVVLRGDSTAPAVGFNYTLAHTVFNLDQGLTYLTGISYNPDKGEYTYTFNHEADSYMGPEITTGEYDDASLVSTQDFSDLFGQKVNVIYKDVTGSPREIYGINGEGEVVASDVISSITDTDGNALTATDKDTKIKIGNSEYRLAAAASLDDGTFVRAFNYNNDSTNVSLAYAAANRADYYSFDAIDNNGDSRIDCFVVYPVTIGRVTYVGNTNVNVDTTYGAASRYSLEDDTIYDGIAKDDYVVITDGLDGNYVVEELTDVISNQVVSKVDRVSGSSVTQMVMNGVTYKIDDTTLDDVSSNIVGKELKKAVAYNGYLFYTNSDAAATGIDNFAVVIKAEATASGLNAHAQARLLLTSGEQIVVDLANGHDDFSDKSGYLVTYTVENDLYTLTDADTASVSGYDFDSVQANVNYVKSTGMVGTAYISDSAVIFVKDNNGNWTTITGAELKTKGNETVRVAYCDRDPSTGYSSVVLAKINDAVVTSNLTYGYVTSGISQVRTDDGIVAQFTLWNGNGSATVTTDNTYASLSGLAKGNIITYDNLGNGVIHVNNANLSLTEAAVLAYDGGENIQFSQAEVDTDGQVTIGTAVNAEITDDTVILYIDSADVVGIEGGSIRLATETADSNSTTREYYTNVGYTLVNGDEVQLLVVEVNNNYSNVTM